MTSTQGTYNLQLKFNGHTDRVTGLKIKEEDGQPILYSASRDKNIKKWKFVRGNAGDITPILMKVYKRHSGFVNEFAFGGDGKYLFSVGDDNTIRMWAEEEGEEESHKVVKFCTKSDRLHPKAMLLHTIVDGEGNSLEYLLIGGEQPGLRILNVKLEEKKVLMRPDNPNATITCLKAIPKRPEAVLCAYNDGAIVIWNLKIDQIEDILRGHESMINAITVSPDGSLCASAGRDKKVILWDLRRQNHQCVISISEIVNCLEFALSAYWLAAGTDTRVIVWDIVTDDGTVNELTAQNTEEIKGDRTSICWINGFTLVSGYSTGEITKHTVSVE
ncbi:guanine nucleotide-binding protein subunit beta-2-like 1 protein [Nematocida sp. AWRm80]|nr:guanine nucleotide-binding protein subunit beta-2-like 1 protein [Nematocida sp. AWRm80]